MKLKLLLFSLFIVNVMFSQDIKRLTFGLNAGVKFANKNYAIRYTGFHQMQLINFFANQNTYQTVRQLLGNRDFEFEAYSDLYRFQPAPTYGVNIGFQASNNLTFEADLNFSNIKMLGGYALRVIDPANFTSQGVFVNGNISGKESRFNGRINMNYTSDGDKYKAIIGLSGIVNSWRMEENLVELEGTILTNLFSQFNPANGFSSRVQGTGFGYGINLGVQIPFKAGIVMQLVYQPYYTRMDYFNTNEAIESQGSGYVKPALRLEHDIMARFVWR